MGRSRYSITEPDKPHFMTCTVLEWLPIFTRTESVQILRDCWRYSSVSFNMSLPGLIDIDTWWLCRRWSVGMIGNGLFNKAISIVIRL